MLQHRRYGRKSQGDGKSGDKPCRTGPRRTRGAAFHPRSVFRVVLLTSPGVHLNCRLIINNLEGNPVQPFALIWLEFHAAQHRAEVALRNDSGGSWEYSVHEDGHSSQGFWVFATYRPKA